MDEFIEGVLDWVYEVFEIDVSRTLGYVAASGCLGMTVSGGLGLFLLTILRPWMVVLLFVIGVFVSVIAGLAASGELDVADVHMPKNGDEEPEFPIPL